MKNGDQNFWPFIKASVEEPVGIMRQISNDKCIPLNNNDCEEKNKIHRLKKLNDDDDNFENKKLFIPRKSRSTTSIQSNSRLKLSKKRHSWGMEMEKLERYSIGDYLRQQIVEDLNSPEIQDKSEEQIAIDRYLRVREYLDQRSVLLTKTWKKSIKLNSSDNEENDYIDKSNLSGKKVKRKIINYQFGGRKNEKSRLREDKKMPRKKIYQRSKSEIIIKKNSKKKFNKFFCCNNYFCEDFEGDKIDDSNNNNYGKQTRRSISCPEKNYLPNKFVDFDEWRTSVNILDYLNDINLTNDNENTREIRLQENYLLIKRDISMLKRNIYVPIELNLLESEYSLIPMCTTNGFIDLFVNKNFNNSELIKTTRDDGKNKKIVNIIFVDCNNNKCEINEGKKIILDDDDETIILNDNNHVNCRDYFSRVYEQLKQHQQRRQDAGVSRNDKSCKPWGNEEETRSVNFCQMNGRKRRKRRKRDQIFQGEEIAVTSKVAGEGGVVVEGGGGGGGGRDVFNRCQLRDITTTKKRRPPPPPPPLPQKYKINYCDIKKYFNNYPNKENCYPCYDNNNYNNKINDNNKKEEEEIIMGSNLSRHNGKGLNGRRTQSSGNLCDPKGKLNHVGKMLVPCSSGGPQDRYKISGSLPNSLDDKDSINNDDDNDYDDDNNIDNNNVICDTISGNLGGTLPHKKRHAVHFSDGINASLDNCKNQNQSEESLDGDPWRYQEDSGLNLIRCKHGNFDLVRKNQSLDTVDSGIKYSRVFPDDKYHQQSVDLTGTLPKRRIDPKWCDPSSIQAFQQQTTVDTVDGDLLIKVIHKPDCELMKHRQSDRPIDNNKTLKTVTTTTTRLTGEHQDQGYASERSPEDEHPPSSLPGPPFPSINPESTYRVILQKSSRGLGLSLSGGGSSGPVRVKRLFPQQPAALSNKLQSGDILLAANGVPLTGLTNYEALEVLRTTSNTVELLVCRLPGEEVCISPPGAPPPPPQRREHPTLPPLKILNPLPPLQIEPCGEFDIEMTKVGGSLGFTLRKVDSSALGHYVRALVREPALSDGRIQPGDKIVAVDDSPLSPMSHEEAVALLRQCGPQVKLRLYRDLAQTPVSALSPTEPDHPLRPPRTNLRQEAVDMLCDLAVRKLSPGTSNGSSCQHASGTSSNSPRRLRRPASRTPTGDREHESIIISQTSTGSQADTSDSDQCSIKTQITNSQTISPDDIIDPPSIYDIYDTNDRPLRPNFLNLSAPMDKPNFQFNVIPDTTKTIVTNDADKKINKTSTINVHDNNNLTSEPASMPPTMSSMRTNSAVAFSYKNPAYQSANPTCGGADTCAKTKIGHSSDQDIPGKVFCGEDPVGTKGLLKWKGVMFAPDDDQRENPVEIQDKPRETGAKHREGYEVFMVELTRGWNSRLGFSLQSENDSTVISIVHPDSVAAKDGRLRQGDVLIMVNDESVEDMPTAEIIDLLRKIRGSIGITVARKKRNQT